MYNYTYITMINKHNKIKDGKLMNKQELVTAMADKMESSKKDAEKALSVFIEVVTDALVARDDVNIIGFGKFATAEVPEKTGTIQFGDRKGETYTTPQHVKPTFKYGKTVKELLK